LKTEPAAEPSGGRTGSTGDATGAGTGTTPAGATGDATPDLPGAATSEDPAACAPEAAAAVPGAPTDAAADDADASDEGSGIRWTVLGLVLLAVIVALIGGAATLPAVRSRRSATTSG
jgi:hypothetical protein